MPVSEDEFERPIQLSANSSAMSKAEQRKSNKPIMEKRRRARINHCLNELKTLILDAMKKDPARHSKLEKADILEMTVKHLQQIQRQQLTTAVATDPTVIMRFKSGFDECAAEVSRYIGRLEGVDNGVKQRLTAHLHRCVSSLQTISTFPPQNMFSALTAQNCDKSALILPTLPSGSGDVNNNSNQNGERIQIPGGVHLIPSRLPTGELALLVPNSTHISSFLNASAKTNFQYPHAAANVTLSSVLSPTICGPLSTNAIHASAFTAVSKNQDYPSPTSSADVIKKEASVPEKDDYLMLTCPNKTDKQLHFQNYNYKVTERQGGEKPDQNSKKMSENQPEMDKRKYEQFKEFVQKPEIIFEKKTTPIASSSSFQRTVADSTTPFVHLQEPEALDSGFKPFQVEIPNSHFKAHISISESPEDVTSGVPVQIHQKPNPNFTLNPNKFPHKSPHKFTRNHPTHENGINDLEKCEIGFEKFLKIEPLTIGVSAKGDEIHNGSDSVDFMTANSSEMFQNVEGVISKIEEMGIKRSSTEIASPNFSESEVKRPRISLNVTLTENEEKDDQNYGNRCKRISVIVEDSSKSSSSSGRENNREVTVNVSSQKDMWRPW